MARTLVFVGTPADAGPQTVSPGFISHAAVFAPTVNQQVNPAFLTHAAIFAPTIQQQVLPTFITHAQVFAPTIIAAQIVNPPFITHAAIFAPSVHQQVTPGFITHAQVFSPQINRSVAVGFITHAQVFTPVVKWDYFNIFEGGTDDVTITTGNTGGASGIAFNAVTIGGGGALTFDNQHTVETMAMKVANASAQNAYGAYTGGSIPVSYGRLAVWVDATPTGNPNVYQARLAGAICVSIRLTSGGKLAIANSAGTSIATTSTTIATGQWWRVEWSIVHSPTVGSASLDLFSSITATSPTETLSPSGADTGSGADEWRFGVSNSPAAADVYWLDIINANDYAKPGAYTADQIVSPGFITHAQVFAPTVRPDQFVTPGFITHAAVFSPSIHQSVVVPFITHSQVFAPTVANGLTVAMGFITHAAIHAPTITIQADTFVGTVVATVQQLGDIALATVVRDSVVAASTVVPEGSVVATERALGEVSALDMPLYAVDATHARVLL